jgi:geranylgeranyl reductase family protein
MKSTEVVIVGGGPAGAACAITCARQGFKTMLLEKGKPGRHKACGGVMPTVCELILEDDLELVIPEHVKCSPPTLGLYYVPPSGKKSSSAMSNYKLINVKRDQFDHWLCQEAENSGAEVLYETEFLEFHPGDSIEVLAKNKAGNIQINSRFLIGADGVFSKVRKQLYPSSERTVMTIKQEWWKARGDFDDHFYTFLKEDVTPTYGYVIPKDGLLLIGTGTFKGHAISIGESMQRFKQWLTAEYGFEPESLESNEGGAIPYNSLFSGKNNIVLVGDAAGFCNPFSGEGIRLGMESGIMAGESVQQAVERNTVLSPLYSQQVKGIGDFVSSTYQFAVSLTDEEREKFVSTELKRKSIGQS